MQKSVALRERKLKEKIDVTTFKLVQVFFYDLKSCQLNVLIKPGANDTILI